MFQIPVHGFNHKTSLYFIKRMTNILNTPKQHIISVTFHAKTISHKHLKNNKTIDNTFTTVQVVHDQQTSDDNVFLY